MQYRLSCTVLAAAAWAYALGGPAAAADNSAQSGPGAGGVIQSEPSGVVTAEKKPALNLSDRQRQTVIKAIVARKSHQATPKEFKPELGADVSSNLNIHGMPPELVSELPQLKQYMYAHLDRRIVIVDALDRKISAMIPLPADLAYGTGGAPGKNAAAEQAVGGLGYLTEQQRRTLYQSAAAGAAQPVPQQPLLAGADAPAGMTLLPLPADVVAQTPRLRDLQYAKLQDGRMVLVDQKSRKVAGIITQDEGAAAANDGFGAAVVGPGSAGRDSMGNSGTMGQNPGSNADPLRVREEDGRPSAYTGPNTTGPNTGPDPGSQ